MAQRSPSSESNPIPVIMDRRELISYALLTTLVNVILMLVKIVTGVVGHSYALIADGIESASDIFVSLITWIGFSISLRPPDKNHPYGHGKIESLAGIFSGVALLVAAGVIAIHSVQEILSPHVGPEWFTLPVLLVVVATKEILARRISALSDAANSRALEGDAWHHRSDAMTSAAAAIGIAIALVGGPAYAAADDWAALVACGIIAINGGRIISRSVHENIDGRIDDPLEESIRQHAADFDSILDIEKCRLRKSGAFYFAEIHLQVDPKCTVAVGHDIAHEFKEFLSAQLPTLQDIVIHIEPYDGPADP